MRFHRARATKDLDLTVRVTSIAQTPPDDLAAAASDPLIRAAFSERFQKLLASATGSSTRIMRAMLLDMPLSIDRGEVTDKGSINQRAVLEHRSQLIEAIYSPVPPAQVITLN